MVVVMKGVMVDVGYVGGEEAIGGFYI